MPVLKPRAWPLVLACLATSPVLSARSEPPGAAKDVPVDAKARARLPHASPIVIAVAFSPDGKLLASCGRDNVVRVWDPEAGKALRVLAGHAGAVYAVAFSPDGRTLASGGDDGTARLWDAETGRELKQLRGHLRGVTGVAFSPDGKLLATGGFDGTARVWDLASGKGRVVGTGPGVYPVRFSADGQYLVAGRIDGSICLAEVATGRQVWKADKLGGNVWSLALSPDGKTLASADQGGTPNREVTLWETATGRRRCGLGGAGATAVAFAPDGETLATGGDEGSVRLWDADGKERCLLARNEKRVVALAFSPDGRILASACHDGTVGLWDVPPVKREVERVKLSPAQAEAFAGDLASPDAGRAYRAIRALAGDPEQAVPFARRVATVDPAEISRAKRLVAELDDDAFTVRENAVRELAKLGQAARPALAAALAGQPSAELRRRATGLLEKLGAGAPNEIRVLRALEVLEHAGTPAARQILRQMAEVDQGTAVAREARASLGRLEKQNGKAP